MFYGFRKGIVYLKRTDQVLPTQDLQEFQTADETLAVETEKAPYEQFHGLNFTDPLDQPIEHARLEIREDLARNMERWFPGRAAGNQILDARINQRLRDMMSREISVEQQQRGFIARKFRAGVGFLRNIRGFFRGETRDDVGTRVNDVYGPRVGFLRSVFGRRNINADQIRVRLAEDIWTPLTPAQRAFVQANLTAQGVAAPAIAGVNPQIAQISVATPQQLEQMRNTLQFWPPLRQGPIYARQKPVPSQSPLDRLIEMRNAETEERKNLLSTTVFDSKRLNLQVLDQIRRTLPQIHTLLVDNILVPDALYQLKDNPDAKALLADLEHRLSAPNAAGLQNDLNVIRNNLAPVTEKREDGKEPSPELLAVERIQELTKNVREMHNTMCEKYNEADAVGESLYSLNRRLALLGAPPVGGGPGAAPDIGHRELQSEITATEKRKEKLKNEINNSERKFQEQARELTQTLFNPPGRVPPVPPGAGADPYANLRTFAGSFSPVAVPTAAGAGAIAPVLTLSTETELFGQAFNAAAGGAAAALATRPSRNPPGGPNATSQFEQAVTALNPAQMQGMEREIRGQYHDCFKKRERITPRELLVLLKEADLIRQGITNPEERRSHALESTLLTIADANTVQLSRSGNNLLAKRLGEAILGMRWLSRAKKWFKTNLTTKDIYKARKIFDYVAGLDKDFAVFGGLRPDLTLTELRHEYLERGGTSPEKRREYLMIMKEIFKSYKLDLERGTVQVHDKEEEVMNFERRIRLIELLDMEEKKEAIIKEVRGQPGDKKAAVLKLIREGREAEIKMEKDVEGRIGGTIEQFARQVLRNNCLEKCREARKFRKDNNLTRAEFKDHLAKGGITTGYDKFGTELAIRDKAAWTWDKVDRGAGFTYDKGARALGYAWKKALRPAGNYLVVKPVTWTAKTAGKMVAFPFVLTGKILGGAWNWARH